MVIIKKKVYRFFFFVALIDFIITYKRQFFKRNVLHFISLHSKCEPWSGSADLGSMWASTPTKNAFVITNCRARCPHRAEKIVFVKPHRTIFFLSIFLLPYNYRPCINIGKEYQHQAFFDFNKYLYRII